MGSSLMNDHGYARAVIWNLVDLGKALYGPKDISEREIDDLLALDQDDIDDLVDSEKAAKETADRG